MHVCLVVPRVGDHAGHVATAVRAEHPDARVSAVWAGDPYLRSAAPAGSRWIDHALPEPSGVGWGRLRLVLDDDAYELARACAALSQVLDDAPAVVLRVGAVAVLGGLADLEPVCGLALGRRCARGLAVDGLGPDTGELVPAGQWSTGAFGSAADAAPALRHIARALAGVPPRGGAGAAFAHAVDSAGVAVTVSPSLHTAGWESPPDHALSVLDVSLVDDGDPLHMRTDRRPARVRLSDEPRLARGLVDSAAQWVGVDRSLTLPGGVAIDATMRALAAEAIEAWRRGVGELPPDPWDRSTGSFLEWLETPWPAWGADLGRYWTRLYDERGDLRAAFPDPAGADRGKLAEWARTSWRYEPRSRLLRATSRPMRPPWHDVGRAPGVNLIGYHGFDSSLGDVVRRMRAALEAAEVPLACLHYHRSGSPLVDPPPDALTDELRHGTNLLVINADQLPNVDADHGAELWPGRRSIGYWFWDVEYVPPSVVAAMCFLDEIWVATPFTAETLGRVTDLPVRVVEVPLPEPSPTPTSRTELGLEDGRFTFLVTFDHLSVTERKNPIGAVEAFRRAFPNPTSDGPMLVVKSINAAHRWVEHERLRLATDFRPDIVVIDRHLPRGDQLAMIAAADCLVSLHRSEGLGLHLMEAMWLGTPTIATRYSGNLHVMDDECALLVDAERVPVTRGEGYFPPEATWADPDLDQAATHMRRLVDDAALGGRLAAAARARMQRQPAVAEAGARIAALLRAGERAHATSPERDGTDRGGTRT